MIDKKSLILSFRPELITVKNSNWDRIWECINQRIEYDEAIIVKGFTQEEIIVALKELRNIYPSQWIKKQYNDNKLSYLNDDLPTTSPNWFPALLLSRLASGVLCCDTSINYLVELGLAISCLKDERKNSNLSNKPN